MMQIEWLDFVIVLVVSLISASLFVAAFSLALRVGSVDTTWRKRGSIALYVLCGLIVLFGIYLIVPALHK
jgi:hypothetical protein